LFGYTAGKVIESFCDFNASAGDSVLAQFHEWMTGTGILYLKKNAPHIATAFTTHATAIGRSIAGNGLPLYKDLETYNGENMARQFNIVSKHSLEKISAINADVFTTVSDITQKECSQLLDKSADVVTPNGFEDGFVPNDDERMEIRKKARQKLIAVAEKLCSCKYEKEPLILATSGRYEYTNKGYNLFVDALGKLNENKDINREILAYILVPGNNYGPQRSLVAALQGEDVAVENKILSHGLHDADFDPILNQIKHLGLTNSPENKVKVVFVPSYLNGDDGVFNMKYYEILQGVDLTAFVSYYEPWGYTPLESIAFGVPTITTSLSGFGMWSRANLQEFGNCVTVIERNETNEKEVIAQIAAQVEYFSSVNADEYAKISQNASVAAKKALWNHLVEKYIEAYELAKSKLSLRAEAINNRLQRVQIQREIRVKETEPIWRQVEIQSSIPEKFAGLSEIVENLWWSWNDDASAMFKSIDAELWHEKRYNPKVFIGEVSPDRMKELEKDSEFCELYNKVYASFKEYMKAGEKKSAPQIAYFSMEYGLHDNLKIFSGGLGILAGDYLKEASDTNTNMIGIGLLYRYGYFKQTITLEGSQQANYIAQDFNKIPVSPVCDENKVQRRVMVRFPGRNVFIKIWVANVGRIPLYLLDTDDIENQDADRLITSRLYGGDLEFRFKQEMILGIGGIRVLNELGYRPNIYHCNEGHAAFIGFERLNDLIAERNLKFDEALEIVRSTTLFTTHTPVPAGHDAFEENLLRTYMSHYPERLKISWDRMMELGRLNKNDKFSMSFLAANISQEVNGVSWLHGIVSQKMFAPLWNGYFPEENHVGFVTNGVHYQTWTAKIWQKLHSKTFGEGFLNDMSNANYWAKINDVNDSDIWDIRESQRLRLINYVKKRVRENWIRSYESPRNMVQVLENLDEKVLTIGFARRFATYKRGDLLFRNPERLSEILNNPKMPVQILFAGKAHPNDKAGQDLIKRIVEFSKQPQFLGKILFIEDYDIGLAKKLVQGVDIWMNTPTRPLEASGTSGMKAVMNGALHFSVLDGWWVEGYREGAGWALPQERVYENQDYQNELDTQTIYNMLENEIVPMFYDRDGDGVPHRWVKCIKKSIAEIVPMFTTKRMIDDYKERFYSKLYDRSQILAENDYAKVFELTEWKKHTARVWNFVEVVNTDFHISEFKNPQDAYGEITLNLNRLSPEDIGIEAIAVAKKGDGSLEIIEKMDFKFKESKGKYATFRIEGAPNKTGIYSFAIRAYAKNNLLPYKQDSKLIMWI
ncbi:MAG: alpha-glucan family phosphorylase, partial [Bacteroidales bacterium]|nr:alpha-glucan family phosphorylase [Bacteroidales bacterium]